MSARFLPLLATCAIFVAAYALAWMQYPNILSTRVMGNLLTDNAYLGIAAVGMTIVILSGGIDLSIGSVIAFSGVFIAVMLRDTGLHPLAVFALLLALTTAFGLWKTPLGASMPRRSNSPGYFSGSSTISRTRSNCRFSPPMSS